MMCMLFLELSRIKPFSVVTIYHSDASIYACVHGDFVCRFMQLEKLGLMVLWLDVQHTISKCQYKLPPFVFPIKCCFQ